MTQGDLQLRIGYWLVSHRQTLRTWWAISLILCIAASFLWALIFFSFFLSQEPKMNGLVITGAQGAGSFVSSRLQPQALTVGAATVIHRSATTIDAAVEVTNPNADWGAQEVQAHYVVNGAPLSGTTTFVNPGSHRPIVLVNAAVPSGVDVTASVVIDHVTWARTAAATLPDPKFVVETPTIDVSSSTVAGVEVSTVTAQATVTNASVYSFHRVEVPILFMNGDRIVAVDVVAMNAWPTLGAKTVRSTLTYNGPAVTSVSIAPQVNRFDSGNLYR